MVDNTKTVVSEDMLKELSLILKEEYGKDLKNEEILTVADSLIKYFDMLGGFTGNEN